MLGTEVNFAGTAWPQVQIVGQPQPMLSLTRMTVIPPGMPPRPPVVFFELEAAGKPKAWSTDTPQAFWRTFVEIMLMRDAAPHAVRFAQRWGDPLGELTSTGKTDSTHWLDVRDELAQLANAWGPPNADGVSRVIEDDNHAGEAEALIRYRAKDFATQFVVIASPKGAPDLALKASSLASFMWASAASGLKRRVAMRKCDTCGTWYELQFKNAQYCSGACRTAHHVQSKKGG